MKQKGVFSPLRREGWGVEWVCLQAVCTSVLREQGLFHMQPCIHLNCDLSQLLGYVISSVGGNCVKQAHVKDSIQKMLNDQNVTFYVRAENKNGKKKNQLRFSSSRCITIIRCLTSLTGRKVSLTHAPMWMHACALTECTCTHKCACTHACTHTHLDTGSIIPAVLKIEE